MPLAPGTQLGPYEISLPLGAGGMGEVYRARDTRLGREVAIKILPSHLSSDPVRKQRFEREAKTISSLNHPHICTLHDIGSQNGVDYLVMECVEGETLAKRLEKGPLPLEQVLKYGAQMADALDKAHRSGVVHRDLKPGNIMLTAAGAKLLDFGLAKSAAPFVSGATLTAATQNTPVTQEGTIVGTFQYMSPEQVEGKELDGRSDIFSLGAVLYEMLAGQRAFPGKSQLSVASAILEKEPVPIRSVKPLTPLPLDHAIRRCLAKDAEERWQTARDLALELKWIGDLAADTGSAIPVIVLAKKAKLLTTAALVVALLCGGILGFSFVGLRQRSAMPEGVARLSISGPALFFIEAYQAASPDGRYLAYTAYASESDPGPQPPMIWLRPLAASKMTPFKETTGAAHLFWSPDSRYLAYFANGSLKKISVDGGAPQTICAAQGTAKGTWGNNATILYTNPQDTHSALLEVAASGGTPRTVMLRDEQGRKIEDVFWPHFLPDGDHFLFRIPSGEIYAGSLRTGLSTPVVNADSRAEYSSGNIFYIREGTLVAQPFDAANLQVSGEPMPLATGVRGGAVAGAAQFSVAPRLVSYLAGENRTRLVLRDRGGGILKVVAQGDFGPTRVSPDGHRVASELYDYTVNKDAIWIYDLDRDTGFRFASHAGGDESPVWSPSGQEIVYSSQLDGHGPKHLFRQRFDGSPAEVLVPADGHLQWATDWSPDGNWILYTQTRPDCGDCVYLGDSWRLSLKDGKKQPLLQTNRPAGEAHFSPDGKWIVFVEMDSLDFGVYVMPASGGEKQRISIGGGISPRWRRDGRELIYQSMDSFDYWSVAVGQGPTLRFGKPASLFARDPLDFAFFDLLPDGKRLINKVAVPGSQETPPTSVVLNWAEELRKK